MPKLSHNLHIIMELKPFIVAIFPPLVFLVLSSSFFMNCAIAQNTPFPVRVGVVLDMDNHLGKMGFICIKMALSDFYKKHAFYRTRLVLYDRDSKRDVIGAAAAALDLLKNVEVQAIIGPVSSMQAKFMINLGDKAHVPIITFSATSPSLSSIRSPYFIRVASSDSSQAKTIAAIVQAFRWREIVPIYVDNEFGEGLMPFLADALENVTVRIPYRSVIPPLAADDQILAELYKLMTMQTRVFIVHMLIDLGSRLFTKAKQLGMMSEDYVWIITDGMTTELDSIDTSVIEAMQGVIGVRPHIPKTKELHNFKIQYKKELLQNNPTHDQNLDLGIFGIWAYDSAVALAMAVEKARVRNATFLKARNISRTSTDLEGFGVSSVGTEVIRALRSTTFRGLAGEFKLVEGQLQSPSFEIINVIGPGARVVGYSTKENGIVRELKSSNSTINALGSIIWPGDSKISPKGWVVPTNGKKLRVGVPVKDGFSEFMHVTWNSNNSTQVEGYCKDIFDMVIGALPYGVQYEYVPFATSDHKSAGSYDELVYAVNQGIFDAVVGDVTIVANRSQYVDFTLPYTESGVTMVVAIKDDKSKKAWEFLRPLTWQLWLTSFCTFVFMGFLIWILERRINEDFRGPPWQQGGMIFWFAFSTIVFAHKERVISNLSRFLLILWFLVILILTQSYTASLTSMLAVQKLQPTITDVNQLRRDKEKVGYLNGTFVLGLLKGMNFDESQLLPYNSTEGLDELFRKGSKNGGIAAAFDEMPYMNLFLANYCSKYIMVGPTYKTDGFGFVFPIGSPLVRDVSRAILNVTEGNIMKEIEKKWFGDDTKCLDSSSLYTSNSLGLESFWGLFMIVGIAGVFAFIIYVIRFLYDNWQVVQQSDAEATLGSKSIELFRRFKDRDLNSHTFKNTERKSENHNGSGSDCVRRVMEPPKEHLDSSPSTFTLKSPGNHGPPNSISSSNEAHILQFRVEHNSSMENKFTRHEGEESKVIEQEIEVVPSQKDQQPESENSHEKAL